MKIMSLNISEKKGVIKTPVNSFDLAGSTGIEPLDFAYDAIEPLLDKELPGVMDMIRMKCEMEMSNALTNRVIAGTKNKTLVFSIPSVPKAIEEYMDKINKVIFQCFNTIYSIDNH